MPKRILYQVPTVSTTCTCVPFCNEPSRVPFVLALLRTFNFGVATVYDGEPCTVTPFTRGVDPLDTNVFCT